MQIISAHINGFALSKQARRQQDAPEYVYGEIDFFSFIALLSLLKLDEHTVFYDLGSGIGSTVLACAMVFPVKKSCGIELFPALHHAAETQKQRLLCEPSYTHCKDRVVFICDDFSHGQYQDATHIFINSTALFGETWEALLKVLSELPHCQVIVTTSKPLDLPVFAVIRTTYVEMSWGVVSAFIHHRV